MSKRPIMLSVLLIFTLSLFFGGNPAFALGERPEDLYVHGTGKPIPPGELTGEKQVKEGEEGEDVETPEPVVKELSLEQAIEIALKNNFEMALNQIAVAKAKVSLEEAKDRAEQAREAEENQGDIGFGGDTPGDYPDEPPSWWPIGWEWPPEGDIGEIEKTINDALMGIMASMQPSSLDLARGIHVGPRAAQMNVTISKMGADFADKVLRLTVENAYYDVLKAQGELANKKGSLERAGEQLRLAEISYGVGLVAKSDVMGAQVGLTNAEVQLLSAENKLATAMMSLAQALGEEINNRYVLTDQFTYEPAEEIDENAYLEERMKTDLAVMAYREGFLVAQVDLDQVAKIYSPNVWTYQKSKLERDDAYLNYLKAKKNLEVNVRQAFLNLKTAEKAYGLLEESVDYAKENARLAALRYEAGLGTRLEMEMANDQLSETETQCLAMLYNYNLAKTQIRYGIFPGAAGGAGMDGAGV
ncbi:MAG: TolC family protein [Bacillota bacterium]